MRTDLREKKKESRNTNKKKNGEKKQKESCDHCKCIVFPCIEELTSIVQLVNHLLGCLEYTYRASQQNEMQIIIAVYHIVTIFP